jgi:hypothetical protein
MIRDAMLSLRDAAVAAGMSKSNLHRAIKSGRISATRTETGELRIDPSELARVYPSRTGRSRPDAAGCDGTDARDGRDAALAALEAEVRLLRELLAEVREERTQARAERDRWAAQAERLALTSPPRRSWWPWQRRGAHV